MNVHIKRMDLFAVLTLTNDAGRRFVTTLSRDIQKTDPKVREMIRRFRREKKIVNPDLVSTRPKKRGPYRVEKRGVGIDKSKQGVCCES